uniref:RNase III domain-containing protein n=1 Tax=Panagrolaimus davidi TaxID=227884 RepID=A0A914QB07_9BILA
MLFDEYCVNTINDVQNNEVEIDTVTQIYHENELSKFEELLEYRFLNPLYLIRAFTHPSHELCATIGSNLELAFIGDPVLDELLLRDCEHRGFSNEQFEKCRRSILNNEHLGILAIRYGFDKYRLVRPGAVMCKKSNADLFEAVIGAVYLDAGKNMQVALEVSAKFLKPSKKEFLKSINLK